MKVYGCLFFLMLGAFNVLAQNLVPNPSFEKYTSCPIGPTQIRNAISWNIVPNHSGTPDYFNACYFSTLFGANNPVGAGVPINYFGYQQAHSGSAYVGLAMFMYGGGYREYIMTKLTNSMIPDMNYNVSFYISLADWANYTASGLGCYFSGTEPDGWPAGDGVLDYTPQVSMNKNVADDTSNWHLITFRYRAKGGEQYLVIGNFNANANASLYRWTPKSYQNTPGLTDNCYIYIDDVLVEECISVTGDTLICAGDSASITANRSVIGWAAKSKPDVILSTSNSISIHPDSNTSYLLYCSCDTVEFQVVVRQPPVVFLGIDKNLCKADSIQFDLRGKGFYSIRWQDGSMDSVYTIKNTGTYSVSVKDKVCYASDTIQITFHQVSALNLPDKYEFCNEDSLRIDLSEKAKSVQWNDGNTNLVRYISATGIYGLQYTDSFCSSMDSFYVQLMAAPLFNFPRDTLLCEGEQILLKPGVTNAAYIWQDGSTASSYLVKKLGVYFVKVSNACGIFCDTVEVADCACDFYVPTAFTPNEDLLNEGFRPEGCTPEFYHLMIFTRWGELIFETNDFTRYWNGTFKGRPVTDNVFVWVLEYAGSTKAKRANKMMKGTVTLLR